MLQGSCLVLNNFTETLFAAISCLGECFGGPTLSPSIMRPYLVHHCMQRFLVNGVLPKPMFCGICGRIGRRRLRGHELQDVWFPG